MKESITFNSKHKFYRPNLFLGEKKPFESEYHWSKNGYEQKGYYQSKDCTIILSIFLLFLSLKIALLHMIQSE